MSSESARRRINQGRTLDRVEKFQCNSSYHISLPHLSVVAASSSVPLQKVHAVHWETFALTLSLFPVSIIRASFFAIAAQVYIPYTALQEGKTKAAFPIPPASSDDHPEAQE